ncbi:hypothetical protein [Actinomadura mexicana]|uniref:hypothetical protein n=1 Tax=Actinomadura mexicana TaxID=134959 RepID=UPI0011775892|nr:hypothetical protein [Actinomadura mexicana]
MSSPLPPADASIDRRMIFLLALTCGVAAGNRTLLLEIAMQSGMIANQARIFALRPDARIWINTAYDLRVPRRQHRIVARRGRLHAVRLDGRLRARRPAGMRGARPAPAAPFRPPGPAGQCGGKGPFAILILCRGAGLRAHDARVLNATRS